MAKYRHKPRFYHRGKTRPTRPLGAPHNALRMPKIDPKLKGMYVDETRDMSARENLDDAEALRHPRERDFYQDHTYHQMWLQRPLEPDHRRQMSKLFQFMRPGFQREPWVWYPGDMVEVVRGDAAGSRGTIIAVIKYRNQLIVQNINVQDVTIPATDTRPEQIVQREHPIDVDLVRHVDPTTNDLTDVRLVKVRNKETGKLETKRISLASGVLMPIPETQDEITSDPLRDTPYHDAAEETYNAAEEIDVLAQRKLRAMEDYFVERLKAAHELHGPLSDANATQMMAFQRDVVDLADETLLAKLADSLDSRGKWWAEEVQSLVEQRTTSNNSAA